MELLREILFTSGHRFEDTARSRMRQDWNYDRNFCSQHRSLISCSRASDSLGEEPREGHSWGQTVSESEHTSTCRRAKPQFELNPTDGSCTRTLCSTIIPIYRTPLTSCYLPNTSLVTLQRQPPKSAVRQHT